MKSLKAVLLTATVVLTVLSLGPNAIAQDGGACPSQSGPHASFDPGTKSFEVMRPTDQGDLLICGEFGYGSTSIRAHLDGDSTIFRLSTHAKPAENLYPFTLDFGPFGILEFQEDSDDGMQPVLSDSTLTDCAQLQGSPLWAALEQTRDYFHVLGYGDFGSPHQRKVNYLLSQILEKFVTPTNILAMCDVYSLNISSCATSGGQLLGCVLCCDGRQAIYESLCEEKFLLETGGAILFYVLASDLEEDEEEAALNQFNTCMISAFTRGFRCDQTCVGFCSTGPSLLECPQY